jgi:4-amino-4-deoxychorismate lyase
MDIWLVDGNPAGAVPVTDRGLSYGDGLFETIAWRDNRPRFFDWHMERLAEGCRRLGFRCPAEKTLLSEMEAAAAGHADGTVKIIVTRGSGPRGYAAPRAPQPRRIVGYVRNTDAASSATGAGGITLRFCRTPISANPVLAGLKTLSRLDQVLARSEWQDPGIAEGLMQGPDGKVVCGTMSNVFLVKDRRLLTPDLTVCGVRGVMRRVVIETAQQLGIETAEVQLSRHDIMSAAELFVTNALIGLWPVAHCGRHAFEIGTVTTTLCRALQARGVTECAR